MECRQHTHVPGILEHATIAMVLVVDLVEEDGREFRASPWSTYGNIGESYTTSGCRNIFAKFAIFGCVI